MSNEQVRWLMKVIQPERTLASLPGGSGLGPSVHAGLLGIPQEVYTTELGRMQQEVMDAADELLADPVVAAMVDRLPLGGGAGPAILGRHSEGNAGEASRRRRDFLEHRRGRG